MPAVQVQDERAVATDTGEERVFDAVRTAFQSGGLAIALDQDMKRCLLRLKRKLERGLWQKSEAFKRVDFNPAIRRILESLQDDQVL